MFGRNEFEFTSSVRIGKKRLCSTKLNAYSVTDSPPNNTRTHFMVFCIRCSIIYSMRIDQIIILCQMVRNQLICDMFHASIGLTLLSGALLFAVSNNTLQVLFVFPSFHSLYRFSFACVPFLFTFLPSSVVLYLPCFIEYEAFCFELPTKKNFFLHAFKARFVQIYRHRIYRIGFSDYRDSIEYNGIHFTYIIAQRITYSIGWTNWFL